MKQLLTILLSATALFIVAACSAPPPPPPAPPPKTAPTTAPATKAAEKPAAEKPTVAEKPAAEKPAAAEKAAEKPAVAEKPAAEKPAAKPGAPPAVMPPLNAAGAFNPANTLIMYGDLALFAGRENPENCILKNRYKRGEPVGFRMTVIEPASGNFAETAEVMVKLAYAGKTESLPMRYRNAGAEPRPGFWTAKWVVPDDAPFGVMRYTVEAKDKDGRTGIWAPYNIEGSMLTIMQ